MVTGIESLFPRLRDTGYRIIGPADPAYNCIAWAAASTDSWWWPVGDPQRVHWPTGVPREETIEAIQAVFAALGYAVCEHAEPEPGFEKVALFANTTRVPTHAARQLPGGPWTSKVGQLECIEHALRDLEGPEYGSVVLVMKRPAS